MATYSSDLAWEIPWTEEPGGLQSMGVAKESDTIEQLNNNNNIHIGKQFSLTRQFQHMDLRMVDDVQTESVGYSKAQVPVCAESCMQHWRTLRLMLYLESTNVEESRVTHMKIFPVYAHDQPSSLRNFVGTTDSQVFHFKAVKMQAIASSSSLRSLSWTWRQCCEQGQELDHRPGN